MQRDNGNTIGPQIVKARNLCQSIALTLVAVGL
jgi:hypothetical protein